MTHFLQKWPRGAGKVASAWSMLWLSLKDERAAFQGAGSAKGREDSTGAGVSIVRSPGRF